MSFTVKVTQGGGTANGMALSVVVLTGATEAGGANLQAQQTGAPHGTLTPAFSGSLIYGAIANFSSASAWTLDSNNSITATGLGDFNDTADGDRLTTLTYTGTVTAASGVTVGASAPAQATSIAAYEIPKSGTIAVDASTPAFKTSATTSVTSNAFTPPAGAVLAVLVASGTNGSSNQTLAVTDTSGLGLTWTQRALSSASNKSNNVCAVYTATIPAASSPAPFYPAQQAIRARLPQPPAGMGALRGRVSANPNPGAPVRNPVPGPAFRQKPAPVRYALPPWQPRAGRIGSSFGAVVQNPGTGPPVYAPPGPSRARLPRLQPRAGRAASNSGGHARNPSRGPVFTAKPYPVQAQDPLPRRGRIASNPGGPVRNPAPSGTGPAFYPRNTARAQLPLPLRGTCRAIRFYPLPSNPAQGPVFTQATSPVQARFPLPPRGRIASNPGGPVRNPAPSGKGPEVYPLQGPVRARLPQNHPPAGSIAGMSGPPPQNPVQGPVFTQATRPAAIRRTLPPRGRIYAPGKAAPVRNPVTTSGPPLYPLRSPARIRATLPPRGRVTSNPGGPVQNPPPVVAGPVFYPRNSAKAQIPLPRRGTCRTIRFGPLPANPSQGPVFAQAVTPARARFPLPPRGRVASNQGGPVQNPPPVTTGSVFFPFRAAVRIRPALPPRGRVTANPGAPVRNPAAGPVFRQAVRPAQARFPLPPRGRTASNPGGPVQNPPPIVIGPVFRQATSPARIRPSLPPRGRVSANPGAPVRNPHQGAVFPAAHGPVRAPVPQVFSKGRVSANPGGPVVFPVVPAPVYPAHGPVRIRPALPPRGRAAGNAGIPVPPPPVPAHVYPLHGPVMARRPLPPRGRAITGNPGAPVRNPHQGAAFHSLPWPARTRIPQNAPRGRTSSNPGGPVANIPVATLLFRLGSPYFQWETGTPGLTSEWSTGTPVFAWTPGVPETSA